MYPGGKSQGSNYQQNKQNTTPIELVFNGDMTTDINGAKLPAWLNIQLAANLPGDFMCSVRQNGTVIAKFIENQYEGQWCHYARPITLCYQYLLHNNTLKQNKALNPL